jgi:hypothetical protein
MASALKPKMNCFDRLKEANAMADREQQDGGSGEQADRRQDKSKQGPQQAGGGEREGRDAQTGGPRGGQPAPKVMEAIDSQDMAWHGSAELRLNLLYFSSAS